MDENTLIKLTLYAYCAIGKTLPKGYVLKSIGNTTVGFYKYETRYISGEPYLTEVGNKPVGFYLMGHQFVLRKCYDGDELFRVYGSELDNIIEMLND